MCAAVDWSQSQGGHNSDPDAPCVLLMKIGDRGTPKEVSQKFFGWKEFALMTPEDRKGLLGMDAGWEAFLRLPRWQKDMSTLVATEKQLIQANKMLQTGAIPAALLGGIKPLAYSSPDAMLADMQFTLASVLTDPLTCWYAMRRTGLWSESDEMFNQKADARKRPILRIHVVGVEFGRELQEIVVLRNMLAALFGVSGPRFHIEFIGCSIPKSWHAPGDIDEANFCIGTTNFAGSYQEYIQHVRYRKPDAVVAYYPGLYDPTYNWLPVLAFVVEQRIPFVFTCASDKDHTETQDLLRVNPLRMLPTVLLDERNPFAAGLDEDEFDPNVLHARNMYVMVVHGGDVGSIVPEIAQQSSAGERHCTLLKSLPSQRDWDALFRDLIVLFAK